MTVENLTTFEESHAVHIWFPTMMCHNPRRAIARAAEDFLHLALIQAKESLKYDLLCEELVPDDFEMRVNQRDSIMADIRDPQDLCEISLMHWTVSLVPKTHN
jgi:hypothetical protein